MGLFGKLFKNKKEEKNNEQKEKTPISKELSKNLDAIKETLKDCDDIVYREFNVGKEQKYKFALIYTDGLIDKDLVSENVLKSLMHEAREVSPSADNIRHDLYKLVEKGNISTVELKEIEYLEEAVDSILVGETILILDNYNKMMVIGSRGWPTRSVSEPQSETVVRGPRDGFTETLKVNTSLVRRRIRDSRLKLKNMQIGVRSKTDVAILYIEDIVDKDLLKEVKKRLKAIEIDAILESAYIEQLIEDNHLSPFPQVESTERPDAIAAGLYEGRVAILIDNTPFSLLVPTTITALLQSSEDYYDRWVIASLIRMLRYIAVFISLLLPALYVAITSYHPGLLPTQLALYIAATRTGVPFPAFIEAFIMEGTIELLREAGTRLSGPIGTTIGIVGGLVIGQAAVEAGIVSPLMVIIVAVTTIANFVLPNYSFATSFRVMRFGFIIIASVLGLYGIMLGLIILGTHLINLKSFGVPYLTPYETMGSASRDLKDSLIRVPLHKMKSRPKYTQERDVDRMPDSMVKKEKKEKGDNDDSKQ